MNWGAVEMVAGTVCLVFVCGVCVGHIAAMGKDASSLERWGFILIAAGAFGRSLYYWWPKIDSFPFGLVLYAGLALIGLAMVRGELSDLVRSFHPRGDGVHRRLSDQ